MHDVRRTHLVMSKQVVFRPILASSNDMFVSVTLILPWPRSEGLAMTIRHPFSLVVVLLLLLLGFQA